MKEKPILFSAPMVLAILEGRKTMTRRTVKVNPDDEGFKICPYGQVGDRLWVRENYRFSSAHDDLKPSEVPVGDAVEYFADTTTKNYLDGKCRPSIFMPRWASRINLLITDIRVERLQDISEEDAVAEGCLNDVVLVKDDHGRDIDYRGLCAKERFQDLWDSINGKRPGCSWEDNPFLWVVSFKRVEAD